MSKAPPRPSRKDVKEVSVVRALYTYSAQNSDELSFEEGDIFVLNKTDSNWWKCRCDEKEGLVPSNYVGENTAQIENPLHDASKRGNYAFAKELLLAGVSPTALDKAGNTPLHWASRGGHFEIVKLLLSQPSSRASLNSQNKLGDTPLHLAAWGGSLAVSEILLNANVDTSRKNNDGKRAKDVARNDDVAALLLQNDGASKDGSAVDDDDFEDD
ncbi:Osteoclast-stimulating factor 1 [Nowakowskiella sp. JEL0078]|nr:Osteoclast-stimulating factor 1 [Nowakowskiella sp. JEL0078]